MQTIETMLDDFQKKFGIVFKRPENLKVISTSYKELDDALYIGGFPEGKIIEISGEAGVGKTLLAYKVIKEAQKQKKVVLYVNAQRDFCKDFAEKVGVNLEDVIICEAPSGESVMDIMAYYLGRNLVDMIVLDSLAALVSVCEVAEGHGNYLQQSIMIEKMLQCVLPIISKKKITMLCLNQIRMNPETGKLQTPFEKTMAYYAGMRIMLTKLGSIKKERKLLGYSVEAKIYKNNYGRLKTVNFDMFS